MCSLKSSLCSREAWFLLALDRAENVEKCSSLGVYYKSDLLTLIFCARYFFLVLREKYALKIDQHDQANDAC